MPCDKADSLLACLLQASRSWTSHPWFNNTGVEGTTHTRSHVYQIPTARGSHRISHPDRNDTNLIEAQRYAGSTNKSQRAAESSGSSVCAGATGRENERDTRIESTRDTTDDDVFKYSEDGDTDDNDFYESTEAGVFATLRQRRDHSSVQVVHAERPEGVMQGPAPDAEAEHSNTMPVSLGRRATSEELMRGQISELAPDELLEIVPLIVQIVRR